ncbi:MAG: DUF2752 domain-containing protein [Planctomycetes bacterium]|nr:DUF2752 domain-containing protein [Planctomycetota bacterium]
MSQATLNSLGPGPIRPEQGKLTQSSRFALLAAAFALAGVLGVARWLEPDQRGYGTHEQFGLPPCAFRVLTGIPCPACGLTTSFAYSVRGQLENAAAANVAGCVLVLGVAGMIPWCLISAVVGRTVGIRSPERAAMTAILAFVAIDLAVWVVRFLFFGEQR